MASSERSAQERYATYNVVAVYRTLEEARAAAAALGEAGVPAPNVEVMDRAREGGAVTIATLTEDLNGGPPSAGAPVAAGGASAAAPAAAAPAVARDPTRARLS